MLTRRSRAREVALQLLFQKDQNPAGMPRPAEERFARERLNNDAELAAFALALFDGTTKHRGEIDPKLSATAENWRLTRMTAVDRNVLRLGAYELLFEPSGQPVNVILDEAIELARRYGGKDSPAFVNGILDKVAKGRGEGQRSRGEGRGARGEEKPAPAQPAPSPAPVTPTEPTPSPPPPVAAAEPAPAAPAPADPKPVVPDSWLDRRHLVTTADAGNADAVVWTVRAEGDRHVLAAVTGHAFDPTVPLDGFPWFDRLRPLVGGAPQPVADADLVRALSRLAVRHGLRFE